jgi:hypothetical protein
MLSKRKKLERLKDLSLMMSMFFLPFGYDYLFKVVMDQTGSYWTADVVFYSISAFFFINHLRLSYKLKKY